jgi:hypothetical protein
MELNIGSASMMLVSSCKTYGALQHFPSTHLPSTHVHTGLLKHGTHTPGKNSHKSVPWYMYYIKLL